MRANLFNNEDEEFDEDEERQIETIGPKFRSQFYGYCAVDPEHRIKRNEFVQKIQYSDNPFLPAPGVACKRCISWLPKGRK